MNAQDFSIQLNSLLLIRSVENKYNRNHVFHDIMDFAQENLNTEELFDMRYTFHLYQRMLSATQHSRLNLAKKFVEEAKNIGVSFTDEKAQAGMSSLYYPAIAYYYYVVEDYEEALKGIQNSFSPIRTLSKLGLDAAPLMMLEQVINEFRINYSAQKYDRAEELARYLLDFAINHNHGDLFPGNLSILANSEEERSQLSKYVIDTLLFKWIGTEQQLEKVLTLLQDVLPEGEKHFSLMTENLLEIINSGIGNWIKNRDITPFFNKDVPNILKLILIKFSFDYLDENELFTNEIFNAFENYNESVTRIPEQVLLKKIKKPIVKVVA